VRGSLAVTGSNVWFGLIRFRKIVGELVKLHYYPETDSLYIELKSGPGTETREIAEGLAVDLDEHGDAVGRSHFVTCFLT
jgi:hypothetical protein